MWEPQSFYSSFLFRQPTVLFGENPFNGLLNYPSARIAVIYGTGFNDKDRGLLCRGTRTGEIRFISKSWQGEPSLGKLSDTITELEEFRPDVIIAVGGGSVIDGAKIARLLYEFPFFDFGKSKLSLMTWKTTFIAVPTTVGSGAEVSSSAVLIDDVSKRKFMVVNHALKPSIVLLTPHFAKHSPERLIITSSIDGMAHILEGYVSNQKNDVAAILAEKGLQIFHEEFSKATISDIDFLRLHYAGFLGGIVQDHCIVGAAHGISHQIPVHGYSHSEAISLLLPAVIRTNSKASIECRARYESIALRSGFNTIEDICSFLERLRHEAGLDDKITKLKGLLSDLVKDGDFISDVSNDMGGRGNPVDINQGFIFNVIQNL